MAQADRLFGSDVKVWSIGDNSTPVDFIGCLVGASVTLEMETKESKALKDTWKYPVAGIKGWKAEMTMAVDSTSIASLWTEANQSLVYCQFDTAPNGGTRYTGTGILTAWTHDLPDGGQTIKLSIVGNSALTVGTVS